MSMAFTPQEISRLTEKEFFREKAVITRKIRQTLEDLHLLYRQELSRHRLLLPDHFPSEAFQFVKGEHLEHFPYQYLDYPRFYTRETKFAFRTLFWWGHHIVFSLILEGGHLRRYKENLINRYSDIADRSLCLCLDHSLWEWKHGPGFTLELIGDRKPEVAAVLANRPHCKLAFFTPFTNQTFIEGRIGQTATHALKAMLPIITE